MTRAFFELLILLKIILYSKYESRHTRRHEGSTLALLRPSILSSPDSPDPVGRAYYRRRAQKDTLQTP